MTLVRPDGQHGYGRALEAPVCPPVWRPDPKRPERTPSPPGVPLYRRDARKIVATHRGGRLARKPAGDG